MANICDNRIIITGKRDIVHPLVVKLNEAFDFYDCLDIDYDHLEEDESIDTNFSSSWSFPKKEMEEIIDSLESTEGLYIRVVSDEHAGEYCEQHIFNCGKWTKK